MKTVVTWIFAGGEIQEDFVADYAKENQADQIVAVDGGLAVVDRLGLCPTYIVGDFDTVSSELLKKYQLEKQVVVRKFQPKKDLTDGEIAVEVALELGSTKIVLFGTTGKRLDHLLGNLSLLYLAERDGASCEILDAYNRIRLLRCRQQYWIERGTQFGRYVSFLPFTDKVEGVTLTGFQYPLKDFTMTRFFNPTLGISNEIVEERGGIWFSEGILFCVESRDTVE